ncbi:MAG: tetratricopeptide repeat protein [Candidatus Cloacimonetes bacterium]|jgi:signal transduction histidine kinase|nr:tetratricopeptide repeat protein [Candidatus Cloacimonadota bacterium]MDD2230422.1 ATP-binding protein [Candidatus Cloacimonadota bacterium]MDY0229982.1 ATP-binding protein [Candidatus Cloacimonadaceae bacterium]
MISEAEIRDIEAAPTDEISQENFWSLNKAATINLLRNPGAALRFAKKALEIAKILNTKAELAQAWFIMGNSLRMIGDGQKAKPWFTKAIKAFDQLEDYGNMARAKGSLAGHYANIGQFDLALGYYEEINLVFEHADDTRSQIINLANIADIYLMKCEYSAAIKHFRRSIDLCHIQELPELEVSSLCKLGAIYDRLFDYSKNMECCQEALKKAEKTSNPYLIGQVQCSLGSAYLSLRKYDSAREYFELSLAVGREYDIPNYIGGNLSNIADVLQWQGKFEEALEYAKEALKYDIMSDEIYTHAMDHVSLGRLLIKLERWDEADHNLETGIEIARAAKLLNTEINGSVLLAQSLIRQKQFNKAERLILPLLETTDDFPVSESRLDILETLSILNSAMGNHEIAYKYLTEYHDISKKYLDQESDRRAQLLLISFEAERLENEKKWLTEQNQVLQQRVDEEVAKVREKDRLLVQQEQMALLGRITAGIAHELHNPLAAIKQTVDITLKSLETSDHKQTFISKKQLDVHLMLNRINRLVEIVKVIAHSPDKFSDQPFDLNAIVIEFIDLFSTRILTDDINLITELGDKLPLVYGDNIRFIQVLSVLVSNANDALAIEENLTTKTILIRTYRKNNSVILELEDNGCGIPEGILSQAPQPFLTTKDVGKGMGMGLVIAYSIVKSMNGMIKIESNHRKGTKIQITIPIMDHRRM